MQLYPDEFEGFIARMLEQSGHTQVRRSGGPGDGGVDIHAITPDGRYVIVQCKLYAPGNLVSSPAVQQFLGALVQHRAHYGLFVTTSDYTAAAREIAETHPLTLMNGDGLVSWVIRLRLVAAQRQGIRDESQPGRDYGILAYQP